VNILLIGLRGSGKSTLGPALAERLGSSFTDLDDLVARAMACASPAEAFEKHGQAAFRQMEGRVLVDLIKPDNQVVALGGGTPTGMLALETIRKHKDEGRARVLYLRGMPATLRDRLAGTDMSTRPSLTGADPLAEIDAVFAKRDPLYSDLADGIVEIDNISVEATLEALFQSAIK
jgi:shikimate kinase